jgi:hypothetical protein
VYLPMSTSIVPPATRRRADQLLAHADRWSRGVRHTDGLALVTFSGSKPGAVYFTSTLGCTCPGFRHRGVCCHSVAVSEHQAEADAAERRAHESMYPSPKRRPTYEDLFPACPCGDIAEHKDGLCDRCASDREYSQRMAARRAV